MKNKFENIDEALEIEATPIEKEIIKRSPSKLSRPTDKNDLDADYEYTRGHYYALLENDGIMFGDDFWITPVRQAVEEFASENKMSMCKSRISHAIWYLEKKD